jgi:hypothetical protein
MHYQRNLWELVGGRGDPEKTVRKEIIAVLHPEIDNPYDANAISVWVSTREDREHTLKAGHLSRDDARRYRPGVIAKQKELGKPVGLQGVIAGGGMREGRPGYLGVFLDHDPGDFGLRRFAQPLPPTPVPGLPATPAARQAPDPQHTQRDQVERDLTTLRTGLPRKPSGPFHAGFIMKGEQYASCEHNHRTRAAALECAQRRAREKARELGLPKPTGYDVSEE